MSIKRVFSLFLVCVIITVEFKGFAYAEETDNAEKITEKTESAVQAESEENEESGEQGEKTVNTSKNADLGLTCRSAVLMEASTGTVIYEQNPDEVLSPASITKIMTLVLIFDALSEGRINLEDMVTTSAHAKSMGGSQVFLEEGEQQTVETLIKCIVVASGNDASVAMAEYIAGSENEFVSQMNKRAAELGMTNTNFEDCCGLTDSDNHHTSARDVAVMSRELITKYPDIFNYSSIWMENITHVTKKGESIFGLANTNKLLKQYQWTTGLKTGSTSKAKYCVSATARKDGIDLIAVVMAAPDYKVRFSEAASMLNYGYSNCKLYRSENTDELPAIKINGGVETYAECEYTGNFNYLSTTGENVETVEKRLVLPETLDAPIKKGDKVGSAEYYLGEKLLGSTDIVASEDVSKAGFGSCLKKMLKLMWL